MLKKILPVRRFVPKICRFFLLSQNRKELKTMIGFGGQTRLTGRHLYQAFTTAAKKASFSRCRRNGRPDVGSWLTEQTLLLSALLPRRQFFFFHRRSRHANQVKSISNIYDEQTWVMTNLRVKLRQRFQEIASSDEVIDDSKPQTCRVSELAAANLPYR